MDTPHVSVVMAAYNDLRFLDAAVGSIIHQTYRDFEFVIVDDGTGMNEIFVRQAARDQRIRIITNDKNVGKSAAVNRGIRSARGDIIVRLDADDVAKPERIADLVSALGADPNLDLVGSNVIYIDEAGVPGRIRHMPETDVDVRWTIHFRNPFCHPSVAFRRACYEAAGGYDDRWLVSADHEFWFRMLAHGRAGNQQRVLLEYRLNPQGKSAIHKTGWRTRTDPLRERAWNLLGVAYDPAIASELSRFVAGKKLRNADLRGPAARTCLQLLRRFAAAPRPLARPSDGVDLRRLVRTTIERMLADSRMDAGRDLDRDDLAWARSMIAAAPVSE